MCADVSVCVVPRTVLRTALRTVLRTAVCVWLVAALVGAVPGQKTVRVAAVVDAQSTKYQINMKTAVEYLNQVQTGDLAPLNVELHVIHTADNDSFAAMDEICTLLPGGVDVIVDLSTRYVTATVRSLAEAVGITHVALVDPSYYEWHYDRYNVSVNFRPPSSILLQSIRDIVSEENLTNVGIIYDHTFNLDNKPKRLLRNIPAQHLYLRMATDEAAILSQLDKIKAAELQHVFLASSANTANTYLGLASQRGMLSFKYAWYVLTKDAKIGCGQCKNQFSVVLIRGRTTSSTMTDYIRFMNWKVQIQASLNFDRSNLEMAAAFQFDVMNIVARALSSELSASGSTQVNLTDCYGFTGTDPAALRQALSLKAAVRRVNYTGVFGGFQWKDNIAEQRVILDIKRVTFKGGSTIGEKLIGNWTSDGGLVAFDGSITNTNVKKSYRVVTISEPPFVFKDTAPPSADSGVKYYYENKTTKIFYYGYCIDLLYHINKTMGFEFTIYDTPDEAYGTIQPNNSWNGMIQELIQDRADIALGPLSVMAERENVVDFTVPYYDLVGITILMKKPKFEYSVFKFMSVLEDAVWGCVFSAFIIVSVLLAVFDKFSPYSYQNNRTTWDGQGEEPRVFTLKEGLWFCMTSLTPQGGGEAPRALSGRLVAATWWMFGFIMIATYTANLAAFLTVSRLDQPIESLDDLAKQFKTKYAPQEFTSTETYFKRMADIEDKFYSIWKSMSLNDSMDQLERAKLAVWDYPVSDKFTNMWVSMQESGFPKSLVAAIDRIKNPKVQGEDFAYIGDATQNKYATLRDCDLWEVGEEFSRKPYALAVQDGSPLKSELSSVILQLLNQRVLEDLKTFWWDFNKVTCERIEDESDGISIYNIGGVFIVIFIGIGLGLITLAFEFYWYKWRPSGESNAKHNGINDNKYTDNSNNSITSHSHDNNAFDTRS